MTDQKEQHQKEAYELIRQASTFSFANEELLQAIAKLMKPETVDEGHIFCHEGKIQDQWFILESGVVTRYKYTDGGHSHPSDNDKNNDGNNHTEQDDIQKLTNSEDYTVLDKLEGKGRVTALFHSLNENHRSYSTLVATDGPVKLWTVSSQEYRKLLAQGNNDFALQLAAHLAHLLRKESKISRALTQSKPQNDDDDDDDADSSKAKKKVLKVLCYDSTEWVRNGFIPALEEFNKSLDNLRIDMDFTTERLHDRSATYATGHEAICTFVNDKVDEDVTRMLSMLGVKMVAQRAAGFDRIDTKAASTFGLTVARVPAYSPYAVAEMAISLLMALNRKITRASSRVRMANFSLDSGLMGMDIYGKKVGVMGTGNIGAILCRILHGFGAKILCYDIHKNEDVLKLGGTYVSQDEIYAQSDVLFLMMPLIPPTHHTINMDMLPKLKKGVLLINTSRGGLVDTKALLHGLKTGQIAGVGMDVYENEADYFFQDWSARNIEDPDLMALIGNNNVILTAHQAFFTQEAVNKIVSTTLENLRDYAQGLHGFEHPNNCIPVPKK